MNKFEKNILENEMGLDRVALFDKELPQETDESNVSESAPLTESPDISENVLTDGGEQLKIDDDLLGSNADVGDSALEYQERLDLSSLNLDENVVPEDTQKDGSLLYVETVQLLESGEVGLESAMALLKKNASNGHAMSALYLGQLYSNRDLPIYNPTLAFDCFSQAAALESGDGYYNLGLCYSSGFGCDVDEDMAAKCFSDGARIMNASCICALGMCYEFGRGCDINYEYAFNLYERAYELGHPSAANNLGGCYLYGHGVEEDKQRAIEIFKKAAELGSSDAECRLGDMYQLGVDVEKDLNTAIEHYKRAAKAKNPIALYKLGVCYEKGWATDQNFNQAYRCFSRAALLGYAPAACEAGKMCILGKGVQKSPEQAYKLFSMAAHNGYIPAQYEVANCFFEGIGTMKDRESAYKYYCRTYDLDNENKPRAAYRIGLCHLKGLGAERDEEEAFEWFSQGCELRDPDSAYMLGECYYFGVGTAANAREAVRCFELAESFLPPDNVDRVLLAKICIALAQCYEHAIGVAEDHGKAILYYKKGAESGVEEASFRAGRAITLGIGMKAEYAAARPYILRAARKGYAPAMLSMGIFSDEGKGVQKNKTDAKNWYSKVVGLEKEPQMSLYDFPDRFTESVKLYTEARIRAQYRLGVIIARSGRGLEDFARAYEYIALSASMGFVPAQNEITGIYLSGGDLAAYYSDKSKQEIARGDLDQTDKTALGDAMNKLGDTFFDGKNILKKNDAAAARCYRYAAELSQTEACYSLGWCLRHGVGVHENDVEAAKWLKMSADHGNANAAYSYALCCEEGLGTGVTNKREAIFYYRMAAGMGHVEAAKSFLALTKGSE